MKNKNKICLTFLSLLIPLKVYAAPSIIHNKEFQALAIMFIKVMIGIVISSIVIYLILLAFKKFSTAGVSNNKNDEDGLYTPEDIDDSIKTFLEKSKNN